MKKFYVLMKVDISEGSDYKPKFMGMWNSLAEAKSVAISALETFKYEMFKNGIDITVYPYHLNAYDDFNMYGWQMNIEEIEI